MDTAPARGERALLTLLEDRRHELTDELARLTAPPEAGSNLSFGKRIGEGTTEAVERISTTATARSIAAALADVDRAIEKLGEGSYGRCDRCSRPIPAARLEAVPATPYCVECSGRPSLRAREPASIDRTVDPCAIPRRVDQT